MLRIRNLVVYHYPALNGISILNAGEKQEETTAPLGQLLPEVESFNSEIQRLRDDIVIPQQNRQFQQCENVALWDELNKKCDHSFEQSLGLFVLETGHQDIPLQKNMSTENTSKDFEIG